MKRYITKKLIAWKNKINRKPLILKGVRQCGKTYILKEFGNDNFKSYHYLNFEKFRSIHEIFSGDLEVERILSELELFLNRKININTDLLIFDEIQECPEAINSLKYFNEDLSELALCCAGSHIGLHVNKSSFPVGKVNFLNMFPMNFSEFIEGIEDEKAVKILNNIKSSEQSTDLSHNYMMERLRFYYITGGLPEIVSNYSEKQENIIEAFSETREMQNELIQAYINDFSKHSGKINSIHIHKVFENIPVQLSKFLDTSVKRFIFKDVIPDSRLATLENPIKWLENSGLVIKVNTCKKPESPLLSCCSESLFKLFLFDVGILGAMLELSPGVILKDDYGNKRGFFIENYSAQTLYQRFESQLVSWNRNTSEIEFLREINGSIIPYEVKAGLSSKAKSLKVYREKYSPDFAVKITPRKFHIDRENRIINLPLYMADFDIDNIL